jgi:hypothetical protein
MPTISKIRFTNVVYEDGQKRYNDELFRFDGYNGAVVLENGGGKTVFIQTALQAVIPHVDLGERKIRDTLKLDSPAHIAIEWILSEKPRRYLVTAVTLFLTDNKVDSFRYVYEYAGGDADRIEEIPFVREEGKRAAERFEMQEYYKRKSQHPLAKTFSTIKEYRLFLENNYHIISDEWDSMVKINKNEGGIEAFFDECKLTSQLFNRLLIPTVEASIAGIKEHIFADVFEKQQEQFKEYKVLKKKVTEFQSVESGLNDYVAAYESLYNKESEYFAGKAKAKGILYFTTNKKEEIRNLKEDSLIAIEKLKIKKKEHLLQLKSLEIVENEEELEKKTAISKRYEHNYMKAQEDERTGKIKYFSFRYAKEKQLMKIQEGIKTKVELDLANLDIEKDALDLTEQISSVHQEMSGFYASQFEKIEKEKQRIHYQLQPIECEIELLTAQLEQTSNEKADFTSRLDKHQGELTQIEKGMSSYLKELHIQDNDAPIEEMIRTWAKKQGEVYEEKTSLQTAQNRLKQQKHDGEMKLEDTMICLQEKIEESALLKQSQEQFRLAHEQEINRLCKLDFKFSVDSLYVKQLSLEMMIARNLEKKSNEKRRE